MTIDATEAPALVVLRRTLDTLWPERSRVADRILGSDGEHARGDAIDISYDPVSGPDLGRLAASVLRDPRTAVVLWRGQVAEPGRAWRPYPGGAEGALTGHLHLAIDRRQRGSEVPWELEASDDEAGDVFWPFDSERARAVRKAQRDYLRSTWIRDTPLGKFLRLDEPDEPPPARSNASPGWELYQREPLIRLVDADTGSQVEQGGKEAATGAAIGAAVGSVLEAVPVVGPILHAASVVIGALGGFFAGLGRDSFHPNAMVAAGWLAIFNLCPGMLYAGVDTVDVGKGEERAARLVRYFLLVSGTVPNPGPLYNPNSDRTDNPYMQKVDPRFPQTDPRHNRQIKLVAMAGRPTPPEVTTPTAAQGLLALIRKVLAPSGVMQWDQAKAHLPMLRRNLKHVRALAGEAGRDVNLETLFGGDVTPLLSYRLAPGVYPMRKPTVVHALRRERGETGAPTGPVIVYGASWCGPGYRAANHLRERGVDVLLKDIDQTVGARAEMVDKLARAGLQARALPVLDVGGQLLVGYQRAKLEDVLGSAALALSPAPARGRTHAVTRQEASTAAFLGTYAGAEAIARAWDALARSWFYELMLANRGKARDGAGYWKRLVEGERVSIPDTWPQLLPTRLPSEPMAKASVPAETGRIDDLDSFPTPGFPA